MGPVGLEHPPLEQSKTTISTSGGAESGAPNAQNPSQTHQDSDLAEIVAVWRDLPAYIRTAIIALVATQTKGDQE